MRTRVGAMFIFSLAIVSVGSQLPAQESIDGIPLGLDPDHVFEGEVTVTGSLIPRDDLAAMSPISAVDIPMELTYSGTVRIEDLLTSLPQVFAVQNSTIAGGLATGTATIDLRNLGSRRTLVLVNGRRLAFGDHEGTDINAIPASLVKRVDLLTGGASAVYGSDAMAGVVNFILDTDFSGVRGGLQYSVYNHNNNNQLAQQLNAEAGFDYPTGTVWDGEAVNGHIALGGAFAGGRGHAVAYIDYRNIESLTWSDRDYLNCPFNAGEEGPWCGGAASTERGTFISWHSDGHTFNGLWTLDLIEEGGDGHSVRPWAGERFNYGPYAHIQRPDEKWNAGAFANYEINRHFDVYMEIMYMNNYTDAQQAPSGSFWMNEPISCSNPMLSEQQREIFCTLGGYGDDDFAEVYIGRRNVEGGPRINQLGHTDSRLVLGLRGEIGDAWSYDFYGLRAESNLQQSFINDLDLARINNALDIIEDPQTGEWVCRDAQARADGCVPWNVFQEGAVTPEATEYISALGVQWGSSRTEVLNLTVTGDLEAAGLVIPSATEGLQVAIGAEHRREWLKRVPDELMASGGIVTLGEVTPFDSGFDVSEFFVEALVPIVQDMKGAQDLSVELGYRWSDYSSSGEFDTYKAMVSWALSPSWRLRGGLNRAVRAPSIAELYDPIVESGSGYSDLCQGESPSATFEECARTGVTADQYGSIPSIPPELGGGSNANYGGNPNLEAETGDTATAGVVWTPDRIHGLSVTLDYYEIEISEAIGNILAETIHRACMETGDPAYCGRIHRDDHGSIWITRDGFTDLTRQNVGFLTSAGIDLNAAWLIGLGDAGFLTTNIMGTYMLEQSFRNPELNYECVGYFGDQCGQPQSLWRHRFRITWESDFRLNLSLAWRYIGPADNDDSSSNPDLADPENLEICRLNGCDRIPNQQYFDLSASYTMRNGLQFTLGINNILDDEPPIIPDYADRPYMNAYGNYDALGRYIFGSVQFTF